MKKFNILLVAIFLVGILSLTGCKNDPTKDFKNPKTISLKTSKGTTNISYDDDGSYEEAESTDSKILKNSDNNFRITFEYKDLTVKDAKTRESNFKKDKNYKVISDVEFNGYKGFVLVDKRYASSQVYLYLDEEKNVVLSAQVSPMKTTETEEELKKASNPEDVLYNKKQVQQILKTITYTK